jgi:hypothetical protein
MVKMAQIMDSRINAARQLKSCVAIPHRIVPNAKPKGFPALKDENAAFLRFDGVAL